MSRKRVATIALVVYVVAGSWFTFGPSPGGVIDGMEAWSDGFFGLSAEQLLNIILLVPFPVLVALRWPRWWWAALPVGVFGSIGIEAVQDLLLAHREPNWGDVAMNSAGVVIGTVIAFVVVRRRRDADLRVPSHRD